MSDQLVDTLKKMSDSELTKYQSGWKFGCESYLLADREWQRRERIKQHEFNKEELELQHQKNTELVKEQVKWVKYSAIVTGTATILAALLGWYLGRESQQLKEQLRLKTELLQQIELRTKNTTSEIRPVQIPGKVPTYSPPLK